MAPTPLYDGRALELAQVLLTSLPRRPLDDWVMGKIIDRNKVNPVSGCSHVVRGETEEELLRNADQHAKEHGIVQVTPELLEEIKAHIQKQ